MPPISPYLDDLLTRWLDRSQTLRKEAEFQKELIAPLALAASGNRLALRERRLRDVRQLEQNMLEAQLRWEERFQRIENWKASVNAIQDEASTVRRLLRSSLWLETARTHQDSIVQRLERRTARLLAHYEGLHERLVIWQSVLQVRDSQLEELTDKQTASERPLYVSRARKQPELDFVQAQLPVSEDLGQAMRQLRTSLTLLRGRLQKAFTAVELQAAGAEIYYEAHKQDILAALKGLETLLNERREQILSDALVHEECRSRFRRIQVRVNGLRCIEELSKSSKRGWSKKLFR